MVILSLVLITSLGMVGPPAPAPTEENAPAPVVRASVRITSPAASDVLYGPTLLRAEIRPPPGIDVLRVEFSVDGVAIGRDSTPPFEARWDAGASLQSHVLRAAAWFSDGTSQQDAVTTRRIAFIQHEVVEGTAIEPVELLVSVTDRKGEPVRGLTANSFEVRESGSPVVIRSFKSIEGGDVPLSIAVLVDRSGSMKFKMVEWADACVELISVLRPTDQLRVAAFAGEMVVLQDFTHDSIALSASLAAIGPAGGSTRLYRALFETVMDMRDLPGRKAVIVLTDGMDTELTSFGGPGSSSSHPRTDETVRMALRSGVTIISIIPGPTNWLTVQDIAVKTGGYWLYPSKDLKALMRGIGERLLAAYVIGYETRRPSDPDRKRVVKVSLTRAPGEEFEVRTAQGTYASVDALTFLKDDLTFGNPAQRARAVREIGRTEKEEAVPIVMKALRHPLPAVRASAAAALAERRAVEALPEIEKRIEDSDAGVRQAAFDALARFGDPAIPYLRECAREGKATRPAALRALGGTGDPNVVPDLAAALEEGDCDGRAAAVEGIRSMTVFADGGSRPLTPGFDPLSAHVTDLLVQALDGSCVAATEWSAVVLGRLGRPEAYAPLLAIARATPDSPRLAEALTELPSYPTKESLKAIETRLHSRPPVLHAARHAAANLYERSALRGDILPPEVSLARLALLGGEEAIAAFRHLLQQPPPEGRDHHWHLIIEATIKKLEAVR